MLIVNQLGGFGSGGALVTVSAFTQTGDADSDAWSGFTMKQRIAASLITGVVGTPQRIRAYLYAANAQAVAVDALWVGHQSGGDAWDAASLAQMLWGGSASKLVSAGTSEVTDWCNFAWDKTSDLIFSLHVSGGATQDNMRSQTGLTGATRFDKGAVDEAATADATGYATTASTCDGILKFDIEDLV